MQCVIDWRLGTENTLLSDQKRFLLYFLEPHLPYSDAKYINYNALTLSSLSYICDHGLPLPCRASWCITTCEPFYFWSVLTYNIDHLYCNSTWLTCDMNIPKIVNITSEFWNNKWFSNYYHLSGWQYQPSPPTIQCFLEKALIHITKLDRKELCMVGAGRTDAGVHAWGQV